MFFTTKRNHIGTVALEMMVVPENSHHGEIRQTHNRGRNNRTHIINSDGPICTIELFYHEDEGGKNVVDKVLIETREFREEYKKCAVIFDDRIIENMNILRKPDGYPQYRYWLDFSECDYDMSTGEKLKKAIWDMYLLANSFENNYEMVMEDLEIADE